MLLEHDTSIQTLSPLAHHITWNDTGDAAGQGTDRVGTGKTTKFSGHSVLGVRRVGWVAIACVWGGYRCGSGSG